MPIYKQTTELTKCADWLTTAAGHDIQYVYFGDKEVFSVWATYDGTLPATYSANGSALADYRVYGSAGGVGDVTESGEPNGYKIPISIEKPIIYGFHINPNDPNSYTAVTYLEDAVGMTPASMGSTAFDYGSWKGAFFMPKPCMLKFDGTVDYYLDPNDYSKKADGTASDYNDLSYGGNVMLEFPKIYYKWEQGTAKGEGYFYVANAKVDGTYHCWSNYDSDNNEIDHFYMSAYNGCTYGGVMRSISGLKLSPWGTTAYSASATYAVGATVNYNSRMYKCATAVETPEAFDPEKWTQFAFNGNTSGMEEIAQAVANDTTAKPEWYIDLWADRELLTGLLYLMSKSLDLQGKYGRGLDAGGQTVKENYVTGALDDKGLFYGVTADGNSAIKVFGIENFWACEWRRTAGLFGTSAGIAFKLTHGTADGSAAAAFNTSGTGYLSSSYTKPASQYVKQCRFGKWGLIPSVTGGDADSTKYFCAYWYPGNGFALVGGGAGSGVSAGHYVALGYSGWYRHWSSGAALSCKPCSRGSVTKNLSIDEITTIYIGNTPLGEDEYVDYGEQKIYRRSNLYNANATDTSKGYLSESYLYGNTIGSNQNWFVSEYMPILAGTDYIASGLVDVGALGVIATINVYDSNKQIVSYETVDSSGNTEINSGVNGAFIRVSARNEHKNTVVVKPKNATPTDPPVPLPALPTVDGTNVVDYAGQSAAVPSRFYAKYRKEWF